MTVEKEFFLKGKTVENEIEDLHTFFQDWFNGSIDKHQLSRFEQVLADEFKLITPNAEVFDKSTILDTIEKGYNTQSDRKIWTENVTIQAVEGVVIATYHELQENRGEKNRRLSTAVFRYKQETPNYCQWIRVHETWIEP